MGDEAFQEGFKVLAEGSVGFVAGDEGIDGDLRERSERNPKRWGRQRTSLLEFISSCISSIVCAVLSKSTASSISISHPTPQH